MQRLEQLKLITILEILTLPPEIPRRQNRKAKYLKDWQLHNPCEDQWKRNV